VSLCTCVRARAPIVCAKTKRLRTKYCKYSLIGILACVALHVWSWCPALHVWSWCPAVVLRSLLMYHGRKKNAHLLKILQFTSHCWGWAASCISSYSVDHCSPSMMQVLHWFIIMNMKLTLNHAAVDLSHALTRKSTVLLPVTLCKKDCQLYLVSLSWKISVITLSKNKMWDLFFYFKYQYFFNTPVILGYTPKCNILKLIQLFFWWGSMLALKDG
jgi:hypothetical protein